MMEVRSSLTNGRVQPVTENIHGVFSIPVGDSPEEGVGEKERMKINGETSAQMDHAKKCKNHRFDTTVDDIWTIDESLASADGYVLACSRFYLSCKLFVLFIPMILLCLPFSSLARIYATFLPYGTDIVQRNHPGFWLYVVAATLSLVPFSCLWAFSRCCDCVFYYSFGVPYCILSKGGRARRARSLESIGPYMGGPHLDMVDILVCALGQTLRHGTIMFALSFTNMIILVPWLKYFVNANPLVYDLSERFMQQISTSLEDCGVEAVAEIGREIVSNCKEGKERQGCHSQWAFVPHFPYPPPSRRWAIGMQGAKAMAMLSHTTHASSTAGGIKHQFVFSCSAEQPIWRVMLWYTNPYHCFTGFAEVSITHGRPSQQEKVYGIEHPMWIISSYSPMLSKRGSAVFGPGRMDTFFDSFLPVMVDVIRGRLRGPAVASSMHQGIVSKDAPGGIGISRPRSSF